MTSQLGDASNGSGGTKVTHSSSSTMLAATSASSNGNSGGSKTHAFSANAPPFNPSSTVYGVSSGTHIVHDIRDMIDYDAQAAAFSAASVMPWMLPQPYVPVMSPMGLSVYPPSMVSRYGGSSSSVATSIAGTAPVTRPPQPIASGGGSGSLAATSSLVAGNGGSVSGAGAVSVASSKAGTRGTTATTSTTTPSAMSPRKEGGAGDKERFSVYAKPWSPQPDSNDDAVPGKRTVDIDLPLWMPAMCCGKTGYAPVPLVPHEVNTHHFVHDVTIVPRTRTDIELKLFFYTCARCPLKTLYGRLTSRKPDVTLRNVAPDVPPICIAHLIDEVAGARVAALHVADSDTFTYDVWLDKPNMSIQVVSALSSALWTCPMFHGYAVHTETDEARLFLLEYLNKFKLTPKYAQSVYPMTLIEAKENV